jgi:hypothetical protein
MTEYKEIKIHVIRDFEKGDSFALKCLRTPKRSAFFEFFALFKPDYYFLTSKLRITSEVDLAYVTRDKKSIEEFKLYCEKHFNGVII